MENLEHLDLSSQTQQLKEISDYAFDRQSNRKPIRKIVLSNNNISKIDNRAFCSKYNNKKPYVNVREIDLSFNLLTRINSCILRQLAKGFSDPMQNSSKTKHFTKVLFKTHSLLGTNLNRLENEKQQVLIECNCEITRANKLVDLEGVCRRSDNTSAYMKQYDCGDYTIINANQIHKYCSLREQFECIHFEEFTNKFSSDYYALPSTKPISKTSQVATSTLPLNFNSSLGLDIFNMTLNDGEGDLAGYFNRSYERDLNDRDKSNNQTFVKSNSIPFNQSCSRIYLFLFIFVKLFIFMK